MVPLRNCATAASTFEPSGAAPVTTVVDQTWLGNIFAGNGLIASGEHVIVAKDVLNAAGGDQ
jgi:hypothetical protein